MSPRTDFSTDIRRGKIGEQIFVEDFLNFLNINYTNVTGYQQFQVIDCDFLTKVGLYEVKANYKDNDMLIFEDWSNADANLSPLRYGWTHTTKADVIVFVSKETRDMVFLPNTQRFKDHYKNYVCHNTDQDWNKVSEMHGRTWRSTFRRVPFTMLQGYISVYQRINRPNL